MSLHAKVGDWNVICHVCRSKVKASESRKRWDGLIVCWRDGCFEDKHPLDMPQPIIKENKALPFTSPEPTDSYVSVTFDSGIDQTGVLEGTFQEDTL